MSVLDPLGDRMKGYEVACRTALPKRMPVIIRVDGKAFHSYTRGLKRPFDEHFIGAMDDVARALCSEIHGAVLAYVQSDEVSILVHNYKRHATQPWFRNEPQKMVSVAASVASVAMTMASSLVFGELRPAHFDGRVFVLPEAEVCNYFLWRQQDATRNSIQMLAQSLYSHSQIQGKNTAELQEMTRQKGANWDDLPVHQKRGRCVLRLADSDHSGAIRWDWAVDREPPIFSQDREYINELLCVEMEQPSETAAAPMTRAVNPWWRPVHSADKATEGRSS